MGGSSGGGGSSGKIEYPAHINAAHTELIGNVRALIGEAAGKSPYGAAMPFQPDSAIAAMSVSIDNFVAAMLTHSPLTSWVIWENEVVKTFDRLTNKIDFNAIAAARRNKAIREFDVDIMPKFRAGMRDAGLVQTSSYKIGEALMFSKLLSEIEPLGAAEKEKYLLALWTEAPKYIQAMATSDLNYLDHYKTAMHYQLETLRMAYTMQKEFKDVQQEYSSLHVTWQLEMHKYMMDTIACVAGAGGASTTAGRSVSKAQSAIGGAMSGAAAGAMMGAQAGSIGGPWGAAIGGAVGLIGGLIS